jgi:hypothetical protein
LIAQPGASRRRGIIRVRGAWRLQKQHGDADRVYFVFGSERLRSGGASAFTDIPTANTNAPAIKFAQRLQTFLASRTTVRGHHARPRSKIARLEAARDVYQRH